MKQSFWIGDGNVAWTAKVAVSPTGHAVARNYVVKPTKESDKADVLRPGDVGITLRLDRLVDGMTPEQRLAAQGLAEAMFKDLMKVLGKHEADEADFEAGTFLVVELTDEHHPLLVKLIRETKVGIHVSVVEKGIASKLRFIPWGKTEKVEPVPEVDMKSKIADNLFASAWPRTFRTEGTWGDEDHLIGLEQDDLRKFHDTWGDEYLTAFLLRTKVDYIDYSYRNLLGPNGRVDIDSPWLRPALEMVQDKAHLELIAKSAEHDLVRKAAQELLDERQAKAAG